MKGRRRGRGVGGAGATIRGGLKRGREKIRDRVEGCAEEGGCKMGEGWERGGRIGWGSGVLSTNKL